MVRVIIFDFDGVITESVDIKTEAFKKLYEEHGEIVKNKVMNHHISNGGMSRYEKFKFYHNNFLNIQLNQSELNQLSENFSKLVLKKVVDAPFVLGVENFLLKYYKDYDFFISSATPEIEIKEITQKKKISKLFKGIYGSPKSKHDHIENIIKSFFYKRSEIVFIGDARNDLFAAQKSKIKFIARITKNNKQLIKQDLKINDFRELSSMIRKIK